MKMRIFLTFFIVSILFISCSQAPQPKPFINQYQEYDDPRIGLLLNFDIRKLNLYYHRMISDKTLIYRVKSAFHSLGRMETDNNVYIVFSGYIDGKYTTDVMSSEENVTRAIYTERIKSLPKRILLMKCGNETLSEYEIYKNLPDLADEITNNLQSNSIQLKYDYYTNYIYTDSVLNVETEGFPITTDRTEAKIKQILGNIRNYHNSYTDVLRLDYNATSKMISILAKHMHPEYILNKTIPPRTECDKQSIELIYEEMEKAEEYSELLMNLKRRGVYLSVECLAISEALWNESKLKQEIKKIKELYLVVSRNPFSQFKEEDIPEYGPIIALLVVTNENEGILNQLRNLRPDNILLDNELKTIVMEDNDITLFRFLEHSLQQQMYKSIGFEIENSLFEVETAK